MATPARPAVALYKFWDNVLSTYDRKDIAFGQAGWHLYRQQPTIISFGGHFLIDHRGRFRIGPMHGIYRRNVIARFVPFLGWSHTHSRYQWLVDFDPPSNYYSWSERKIGDWQNPVHYVSEDLLGCRLWRQHEVWCVLEQQGDEWTIQPAKNQVVGERSLDYEKARQRELPEVIKRWRHYEGIVAKRYDRLERLATGHSRLMSVRAPTMLSGNQPLPTDQAVERLHALMEVDMPAKTTPLKRPKEARNGSNTVVPANTH